MKEHQMIISQNWFWWGRIQLTNIDCSGNWSLIGECVTLVISSHNYIVIADHWLTVGSWVVDDVLTAQPGLPSICSCISALIVWCHHDSSILWPWILAFITSETLLHSEAANTVGCTSDFVMKLSAVLNRIILIEKSGSPIPSCHSSSVSDAKLLQQNMDLQLTAVRLSWSVLLDDFLVCIIVSSDCW